MSGPSTQQNGARRYTAKDWDDQRPEIAALYQDHTLEQVRLYMRQHYGLEATAKQYKDRISKWVLYKNVRPEEMEAIVRKEEERAASNKQSDFQLRGRPVNPEKITRYIKKHPELAASANDMVDVDGAITTADTPADISVSTPSNTGSPMPLVASSPPGTSNQYLASNITSPHTVLRNPEISSAPPNPLPQHPDLMMVEPISPALDSIPPYPAGPIPSVIGAPTSGYIGQRPTPTRRYFPTLLPEPESGQGFEGHSSLFDSFLQTQLGQQPSVHPKPTCRLTEDTLRGELSIMETLFGRDHPETLSILLNLAEMLLDEGRYSHAEEIIRRLLDSYSNGYKDNEISRLEALQLLSVALWRQGLYVKAEEISLETIQSRKSLLGVTHPDTLQSMTILALNYNECGRIKEAEDLLVKIIEQGNRDSARKSGEALHCKQM